MTLKLPITITQEGLNALLDAEEGITNSVFIAQLGLTATPFVMAPTLEALPGEFARLDGVHGAAVSDNTLHFTATDDTEATYTVTGVGIYLDNGVLFGVFSQTALAGPLFQKSTVSSFLFACDIAFVAGVVEFIEFGDANFLYPPATRTRKGVAYLAAPADIVDGTDDEKIVTPAQLAGHYVPLAQKGAAFGVAPLDSNSKIPPVYLPALDSIDTFTVASEAEMLALAAAGPGDFAQRTDLSTTFQLMANPASDLGNWIEFLSPGAPVRSVNGKIGNVVLVPADLGAVPDTRSVTGTGLATGGGALTANRAINVAIADVAETLAGLINNKAVTPASLAGVLTALAGLVPQTRHVDTAGLATGGGDLTDNRTITVPKALAADVEEGTDDTKALTALALWGTLRSMSANGYLRIPGSPLILQWATATITGTSVGGISQARSFPFAFPNACWQVNMQVTANPDDGDEKDEQPFIFAVTPTGFKVGNHGDYLTYTFTYLAIGY